MIFFCHGKKEKAHDRKKCKKCLSTRYVKSGHVRGYQRYRCKNCGCQFTDTKPQGVNPALKSFAIVLYVCCGISMGNIARIFKVSTVAVLKWVKAATAQVELQEPQQDPEVVMIEESPNSVDLSSSVT